MKNYLPKIWKACIDKDYRWLVLASRGFYDAMDDKTYIEKMFKAKMGSELNLSNPRTFSERLQWLKLFDRNPLYTQLVDKYAVREYVKEAIGEEYLIPLLGVYDHPDDIDFNSLPDQFVLKCNHNSGLGMCICKDKNKLDIEKVKNELNKGLKQDYYLTCREWPYKDVPRKIICEKFMQDSKQSDLIDYKIMCFNGEPKYTYVCSDRFTDDGLKITFFDNDWNVVNIRRKNKKTDTSIKKPVKFDDMLVIARKLSKGIPFSRIDLYEINGRVYFGEITFFPASGFSEFEPETADRHLGELFNNNIKGGF